MQILGKASHITSADVATRYEYPATRPWVRANMIATVDGAAGLVGRSGELGGDGDRLVFAVLRRTADVVVVGASTALSEGYRQPDGPALVLVSRSLEIPVDYPPLPHARTLILTCAAAPSTQRAKLREAGATLVDCGIDDVEPRAVVNECVRRGWPRILCEGGPRLLGSFVAADELDELCLTTAPLILGGTAARPVAIEKEHQQRFQCEQLLTDDDGYLYARWIRVGDRSSDMRHVDD